MKIIKSPLSLAIALALSISFASMVKAQSQNSSPSAELNDAELTQNIKERIKKIATQSSTLSQKRKIAFIGSIEKIANETITIKTDDDINLASVSATTTYARMPGSVDSKLKDVSIGDFAVAMGFTNGSDVLQTKRILLYDKAPDSTKKTSIAGLIKIIDREENAITLIVDGEDVSITLTKKTTLKLQTGIEESGITLDDLKLGQYIAIIYLPAVDEYTTPKALSVLATSIVKELPKEEVALPETPENPATATPSAKPSKPPELIR